MQLIYWYRRKNMKAFISVLAAMAIATGSVAAVPFRSSTAVAEDLSAEFDFNIPLSTAEKDGVSYDIFKGYAAVNCVSDENTEEFTVPETINDVPVVGIEWGAFRNCKNIKKLTLGKNVSVMEWSAIAEQTMEEIAVTADNESFTVADGILYSKDMKTVVAFPPSANTSEVKIADEAETIAPYAFISCHKLTKIELSSNIREIGMEAFAGCINLTGINIPDGIKVINAGTFMGTKALKNVKIPGSVEYMYSYAFKDSGAIENDEGIYYVDKWAVDSDNDIERADIRMGTVGTIEGLFVSKNKLKVITVPESVIHLGKYLSFGLNMPVELVEFSCPAIPSGCLGNVGIREVWINDPNCKIEDDIMTLPSYWKEPKSAPVKQEDNEDNDYTIKHVLVSSANSSANILKAVITSLIELDEDNYFVGIEKVKKKYSQNTEDNSGYAVAQPVVNSCYAPVRIGNPAKYDTVIRGYRGSTAEDYSLKYRRIFDAFVPASANVGPGMIDDPENGVTYWVYSDSHVTAHISSDNGAESQREITVSDTVQGAPVKGLYVSGANAGTVHIPATVESFEVSEYSAEDKVAYYDVDEDNPYLASVDGILYSKDMTKLIKVPSRYKGKNIVVPDSVKKTDNFAFFSLDNVESIELPKDLEVIGRCAFSGSEKLESVKLSENLAVISDNAFCNCSSLKDLSIPESVYYVGYNAFTGTSLVKYEDGLGYKDCWLVEVKHGPSDPETKLNIKEGTIGIACIYANSNITIPKSVTKMSWKMIEGGDEYLKRADVYSHVLDYDAFINALFLKDIYFYDPECEICAGKQTIRAKHYEYAYMVSYNEGYHEQYTDARTLEYELSEIEGKRALEDTVIHGYKGSTAEAYADMYGIKFEAMDDTSIYKNGDLNGDGKLNVADLVLMNRFLHGTYSFDEKQFSSADLNGDGKTDIFDVIDFRRKILEGM